MMPPAPTLREHLEEAVLELADGYVKTARRPWRSWHAPSDPIGTVLDTLVTLPVSARTTPDDVAENICRLLGVPSPAEQGDT